MKGTAPKTEGHYPDYQFPPPPKFRLEEVNQEIRNRQLEMVDSYNSLHQDVNICLALKGVSQFTNRSDDVQEKLRSAYGKLNGTRAEVVRALAHIIRLGGTPPPPDEGVNADVCQLLDAPPILDTAYQAAGLPAPAPPPPAPRPRPNPPAARPPRILPLVGRYPPPPYRAQIRLPGDQAGLLHPQGEQADIRPLGGQQARTLEHMELLHYIVGGKTDQELRRERALARQAQRQAQQPRQVQQQQLQPPLPVQEQPQAQQLARPVQEPVRPAPVQEPVRPAPVQEPVRRTGNKRGRDDTSSSSGSRRWGR